MLLTLMALGVVVTLVGVNGVFAVFTDRATTGDNSASSRAEARSADLQIAVGTLTDNGIDPLSFRCGAYVEDLETGIITVSNMDPGGSGAQAFVCLKNVGSRTLDVTASVIDLTDTDTACTGDENALDTTCGENQAGELSGQLNVVLATRHCTAGTGEALGNASFAGMVTTPYALPSIAPGASGCVEFVLYDQAQGDAVTTSQSDTATWKFAFDGTAV